MSLSPLSDALDALRAGRPIIVADDENRENEGDIIISAELATAETMAWMVRWASGLICAPMPADLADRLNLPPMVETNQDARTTAYTVSVDAAEGVTTGISAHDRALTLNVLANPASTPTSLIRPGHILPLRAVDGGDLVGGLGNLAGAAGGERDGGSGGDGGEGTAADNRLEGHEFVSSII